MINRLIAIDIILFGQLKLKPGWNDIIVIKKMFNEWNLLGKIIEDRGFLETELQEALKKPDCIKSALSDFITCGDE